MIAVALNANSVAIVKQISSDSALRGSLVAAAQSAKQPESSAGKEVKEQMDAVKGEFTRH